MSKSGKGGDGEGSEEATYLVQEITPIEASEAKVNPEAKAKRPPSPRKCRDFIRRETASAMPKIVNTFVDKAKDGSVSHFNALAKVGGFDQRTGAAEAPKRRRKSLARQLLDEVEKYEAKQAAEAEARQAASEVDNPGLQNGTQERS